MDKPVLIYDGDCSFCKFWAERWKKQIGDEIDYQPFQKVYKQYDLSKKEFSKYVWFIADKKYNGAEAAFEALARGGNTKWRWLYNNIPLLDRLFEFGYKVMSSNRSFFFKLTKLFYGKN